MPDTQAILDHLKAHGHRHTRLREVLINRFTSHHGPLDYLEITAAAQECGLQPNKTSIYRELDFLLRQSIIQELDLGEGKKRYEILDRNDHHHHLVCEGCHSIEAIHLGDDLANEEAAILKTKKFLVKKHMLEFFGLCQNCQQKGL